MGFRALVWNVLIGESGYEINHLSNRAARNAGKFRMRHQGRVPSSRRSLRPLLSWLRPRVFAAIPGLPGQPLLGVPIPPILTDVGILERSRKSGQKAEARAVCCSRFTFAPAFRFQARPV